MNIHKIPAKLGPGSVLIIVALVVAVAGGGIYLVNRSHPVKVVQCNSETCFEQEFTSCHPSDWTISAQGAKEFYRIDGNGTRGCSVTFSTSTSKDVSITCDFDNSKSFVDAQAAAEQNPNNYHCVKD